MTSGTSDATAAARRLAAAVSVSQMEHEMFNAANRAVTTPQRRRAAAPPASLKRTDALTPQRPEEDTGPKS